MRYKCTDCLIKYYHVHNVISSTSTLSSCCLTCLINVSCMNDCARKHPCQRMTDKTGHVYNKITVYIDAWWAKNITNRNSTAKKSNLRATLRKLKQPILIWNPCQATPRWEVKFIGQFTLASALWKTKTKKPPISRFNNG